MNDNNEIPAIHDDDLKRILIDNNLIDKIGSSHSTLVNALTDIAECSLPLPYQKEVIDDYIARITENTKNIREQELQQQFKDVLAPSAKAEILQKLIDLKKE